MKLNPIRSARILVVDATTGQPLPRYQLLGSYWNQALGLTVLNEEGIYVLRSRESSPFGSITVIAPGYLPCNRQEFSLGVGDEIPLVTVKLMPAQATSTVAGILLDPDGQPHADKEISLIQYAVTDRDYAYDAWGNDPDGWESVHRADRVRTDAEGRFSFLDVPANGQVVDLIASDPSIARTRFKLEEQPKESWSDLRLEVGDGARVRGRWNLDLAQRPARVLYLYRVESSDPFWITIYVDHLTGEFEFPAVQPGKYRIETDPSTFPDQWFDLAEGNVHEVEWGFKSLGSISGQLTEERGRWANRLVMLRVGDGIWADKIFAQSTDAEGRFEFTEIPPGQYTVAVDAESSEGALSDFDFPLDDQWWLGSVYEQAPVKVDVSLEGMEAVVNFDSESDVGRP